MQFFCNLFAALCYSTQIFWTKYNISPLSSKVVVHVLKICYNQPIKEVSQNVFKIKSLLYLRMLLLHQRKNFSRQNYLPELRY
nr:MAG TPA: hypothetical protein [Caudoviricetes sp.]